MQWDRAEMGFFACLAVAAAAWGGLPLLGSHLSLGEPGPWSTPLVYLAFGVAVSVAMFLYQALRSFSVRRIEDRPTSRVRSLAAGAVELEGRAGEATLISPLFGKPCVYWDYEIWKGDGDDGLNQIVFHTSLEWPIPLRDDTGSVWIDGRGAEFAPLHQKKMELEASRRHLPREARLLELHGVVPNRKVVLQERWIESGDPLFVQGACQGREDTSAAVERVESNHAASRRMEERERADPSIVATTALACASRAERRHTFEQELEQRLGARAASGNGPPGAASIAALTSEARESAERALSGQHQRFARWYLAGCERQGDPAALALAAHIRTELEAPDQPLVVGANRESGSSLYLRCVSEATLLAKDRSARLRLLRGSAGVALVGLALGASIDGARFLFHAFALSCFTVPFTGSVWFLLRTHLGRQVVRLHTPTEETRLQV